MDARISYLKHLLSKDLSRQWSVEEMARMVRLSASQLHKLFKQETGMTPAQFLHLERLQRSCRLLETSFEIIKEIRIRVGINDNSHFIRDFKKRYGVTPGEYRQMRGAFSEENARSESVVSRARESAIK